MTGEPFADIPAWPHISAVVRDDATAEVTVNGTPHPINADSVDAARAALLDLVRQQTAVPLGRAVRVHTKDPHGQWQLIVHPNGDVDDASPSSLPQLLDSPVAPAAPAEHPPNPAASPATVQLPRFPEPAVAPAGAALASQPGAAGAEFPAAHSKQPHSASGPGDYPATPQAPPPRPAPPTPATAPPAAASAPPRVLPAASHRPVGLAPNSPAIPQLSVLADHGPTLDDLLASRPAPKPGPAKMGWQGAMRRASGGWVKPAPGKDEMAHRQAIASVQRSLNGPKTIVIVNPKGGANKTTASLLIAATFGIHRGGYTLAWDNNETRGTLGWRAHPARHTNTAVDLLRDLDRFTDLGTARVGDLDNYVRTQGSARFDVLASDEDAAGAASIDATAFHQLHGTLSRFYRVLVVDTGNNMRASNWQAAVEAADQLVIVSTVREDTAQSAAWLADGMRAIGQLSAVQNAITVLTAPSKTPDAALSKRLHEHFGQLTRAVLDVPHDPALVDGGPINYDALTTASREAWLRVSAAIADGL